MNNYKFNSIVSHTEVQALKDMIFKRARERAESMNKEAQETYTTNIQFDVMNVARESLVANKNPFIFDKFEKKQDLPTVEVENNKAVEVEKQEEQSIKKDVQIRDIGFGTRNYVKTKINDNVQIKDELIATAAVNENIQDTRKDFRSKSTFLGALDFLNSQATISLVRSKDKSFDAIA